MKTFVVMAPPEFEDIEGSPTETDRLQFISDSFAPLAFLFSGIWLLVHRMWLVFLGYLGFVLVIELLSVTISREAMGVVAFCVTIIFGFEAQALRRWSLERRKWRVVDIIDASNKGEAALKFLHRASENMKPKLQSKTSEAPVRPQIVPRIGSEQVVGLTLGPETRQ